ncbi:MAG: hypothetical protein V2J62_00935 [candidate division KSB1 bacterium]|jgi:hypothetical protein|nr:hypothetical protein [candidate division KSB1 bacterium]
MKLLRWLPVALLLLSCSGDEPASGIRFMDSGYPGILDVAEKHGKLALVDFYSPT